MSFNTLLTISSAIAMGDGVVAILAPGPFLNLIWPDRSGPEAHLFVQGWGSCLIAFSVMAWIARSLTDTPSRRVFALGFFSYYLITSALWLLDAVSVGWTILSAVTFGGLLLFSLAFAYFRFASPASV